jgi:hypothetical protein
MRKTFALCAATAAALVAVSACTQHPTYRGALEGFRGTTLNTPADSGFATRLTDTPTGSKGLPDETYSAQTYDAVVTIALATEAAGTDGIELARHIVDVTRDGQVCHSYAECVAIIRNRGDIQYVGPSGANPLNDSGEPDDGQYQVNTFGPDDRIIDALTSTLDAPRPASMDVQAPALEGIRSGDGTLHIGALLPVTGIVSDSLPGIQAAVELANADVNAAGGVLGQPMQVTVADSGDSTTDTAITSANHLLELGVDAIVGPTSSAVTLKVIDRVVASGVVLFSPSNTATSLTGYDDRGLYFRNAPSDLLQGAALARLVAESGARTAYVLAVDDTYGSGLAQQLAESLATEGVQLVGSSSYEPTLDSYFATVAPIRTADPDAIVLVGFGESSRVLRALVVSGLGPRQKHVFGADGNTSNAMAELFDASK